MIIYVWDYNKELVIYSIFEDKIFKYFNINEIYKLLNLNLGSKSKILLLKNNFSLPDMKLLKNIDEISLGCIYNNDFNLLPNYKLFKYRTLSI